LGWEEFSGKSVGLVSTRPCTKRKEVGGVWWYLNYGRQLLQSLVVAFLLLQLHLSCALLGSSIAWSQLHSERSWQWHCRCLTGSKRSLSPRAYCSWTDLDTLKICLITSWSTCCSVTVNRLVNSTRVLRGRCKNLNQY
jgi:hypothetical protein